MALKKKKKKSTTTSRDKRRERMKRLRNAMKNKPRGYTPQKFDHGTTVVRIVENEDHSQPFVATRYHFVPTTWKTDEGEKKTKDLPYACLNEIDVHNFDLGIPQSWNHQCAVCEGKQELMDSGRKEAADQLRYSINGYFYGQKRVVNPDGDIAYEDPVIFRVPKGVFETIIDEDEDEENEFGLSHPTEKCPALKVTFDKNATPKNMYKIKPMKKPTKPGWTPEQLATLPPLLESCSPYVVSPEDLAYLMDNGKFPKLKHPADVQKKYKVKGISRGKPAVKEDGDGKDFEGRLKSRKKKSVRTKKNAASSKSQRSAGGLASRRKKSSTSKKRKRLLAVD